ncbi:MAG: TonB-dependent receptor plug domain-containing protein, partial [Spirochaetota bacterium]
MPVFIRPVSGALALATFFVFASGAIQAEGPVSGSITISAPAPAIKPAPTAGRSEIGADEIEASGAGTVTEVLASSPGVTATMTGAVGSVSTVSIRGSTSNQVLVIVDGSPVAD